MEPLSWKELGKLFAAGTLTILIVADLTRDLNPSWQVLIILLSVVSVAKILETARKPREQPPA